MRNSGPFRSQAVAAAIALFLLKCAVHRPYDTLEEVIGLRGTPGHGSLAEWGIHYDELPRHTAGGAVDFAALPAAITPGALHRQLHCILLVCWS